MKLMYVERCKEWSREMLKTSKRSKPFTQKVAQGRRESGDNHQVGVINSEGEDERLEEDDDIILDDSDDMNNISANNPSGRKLRKRNNSKVGKNPNNSEQQ